MAAEWSGEVFRGFEGFQIADTKDDIHVIQHDNDQCDLKQNVTSLSSILRWEKKKDPVVHSKVGVLNIICSVINGLISIFLVCCQP